MLWIMPPWAHAYAFLVQAVLFSAPGCLLRGRGGGVAHWLRELLCAGLRALLSGCLCSTFRLRCLSRLPRVSVVCSLGCGAMSLCGVLHRGRLFCGCTDAQGCSGSESEVQGRVCPSEPVYAQPAPLNSELDQRLGAGRCWKPMEVRCRPAPRAPALRPPTEPAEEASGGHSLSPPPTAWSKVTWGTSVLSRGFLLPLPRVERSSGSPRPVPCPSVNGEAFPGH